MDFVVRLALILIVFTTGCSKELESLFYIDPQKSELYWPEDQLPIKVKLSESFTSNEQALFEEMVLEWEASAGCNLFEPSERVQELNFTKLSDYFYKDRENNGVYKPQQMIEEMDNTVLAASQLFLELENENDQIKLFRIIHADIVFNSYHFNFNEYPLEGEYDLKSLFLHEIGHFLGLFHSSDGIMKSGTGPGEIEDTISSLESDTVFDKYGRFPASDLAEKGISIPEGEKRTVKVILYKTVNKIDKAKFELLPAESN